MLFILLWATVSEVCSFVGLCIVATNMNKKHFGMWKLGGNNGKRVKNLDDTKIPFKMHRISGVDYA